MGKTARECKRYIFRSLDAITNKATELGVRLADGRKVRREHPSKIKEAKLEANNESDPVPKKRTMHVSRCMWAGCGRPSSGVYCSDHMAESGLSRRKQVIAPF